MFWGMKYVVLFSFFLLLPFCVKVQTDGAYIRAFPQEFTIRPYFYYKFTSLETDIKGKEQMSYMPNIPVGVGIGFTYKNYALNLAYAPPFFRDKEKGKTQYYDLQYHYYSRKYLFDLFFQDYKGFYSDYDKVKKLYPSYPDMHIIQYGATGQYVFNHRKFSYRAAFYNNEKQVRSASSFQVGGGFYYNKLYTEETAILAGRDRFRNYQLSITGGYVYTWVFKKDYFFTFGLTGGINLGLENIRYSGEQLEVTPNLFPRVAGGYNGDDWALSFNFVMNQVYVTRSGDMNVIFNTARMNLCYVRRLNWSPGILKKNRFLNR